MLIKKTLLLLFTCLFILSCESTDDKQTLQQIAITLIANYAEGKGPVPTIRNYEDAGIIGVNERNIDELNAFIETLVAEDVDTEEELNAVINALGVSLSSDIFGPVITLHGANPLTIEQGSTFVDPGATAIDSRDGEVTVYCEGEVDTTRVGTYIIRHSAVDEAGNLVTIDRVINVITPPPVTPATPPILATPITGYFIHFTILQDDPFLSGINISITMSNSANSDSVTHNWTYPNVGFTDVPPFTQQTFSLPAVLQTGDNYNITLISFSGPPSSPTSVPFHCYIPTSTITTGTIGSSDITLVLECSNLL